MQEIGTELKALKAKMPLWSVRRQSLALRALASCHQARRHMQAR